MTTTRRRARLAAVLFLITWITSVAAVPLYGGSALGTGEPLAGRSSVLFASALEVILAAAVVGTALALYPLLRGHDPAGALGYVALRTLEAGVILVGVVAILPAVAIPGSTAASGMAPEVVRGLHLLHDWTFVIGPGLINPVNAAVLATVLWRHRLVAPFIPALGLVGAALVAVMNLAVLFGFTRPLPALALPLFAWEISLASYLAFRGLRAGLGVGKRGEGGLAPLLSRPRR
ncbi:DUF4386 domain-containing protein [Janibacter sp. GXQ6167]|uniref:DUF4386 domain-containing protein n=1 Tax=Janibacter sp. GXQ6167 TaxID=3240791 RepID=UPI00352634C5